MVGKISAIINTLNEEVNIERAIKSVDWTDEIIVCDMHSNDKTVEIAKKLGVKVIFHKKLDHVEPARNYAVAKASGKWILILDPDEEIPSSLKTRLMDIANKMKEIDYVRIPRKNIIFGKWIKTSMWWPDLNVRFFKQGKVRWSDKIHRPPQLLGLGIDLETDEKWAIIHHHYQSIQQFLERMTRYCKIQANELIEDGYIFSWQDLIKKPMSEFLSRFFANKGFQDGVHGLSLSLLQAFSELCVYLRIWEAEKFKEQNINLDELGTLGKQSWQEVNYWFKLINLSNDPFKRFIQRIRNKI